MAAPLRRGFLATLVGAGGLVVGAALALVVGSMAQEAAPTPSPSPAPTVTVTVASTPEPAPTVTVTETVTAQPEPAPTVTVTETVVVTEVVTAQPEPAPTVTVTANEEPTVSVRDSVDVLSCMSAGEDDCEDD